MQERAAVDSASRIPSAVVLRWVGLSLLLTAELLGVTNRFDTASLEDRPGLVAAVVGNSPAALNIVLALIGVFVLIVGRRLPARIQSLAQRSHGYRWIPWLGLHLVAFAGFLVASDLIFDEGDGGAPLSAVGASCWMALALITFLMWLMSIAPWPAWRGLAVQERRAFLASATIAVCAWLAGQATQVLWKPLANATFWVSRAQLELLYPHVIADPGKLILGTPDFKIEIAPSCSGYEGIGLIIVFVGVYLWLFRNGLRFPQALALLPISALIIWLFNTLRITALIAIGSSWSPAVAAGGFHSQAGWISFITAALIVVGVAHRVRLFADNEAVTDSATSPHATLAAALLTPFVVLMATAILTSAATSGFDTFYAVKVLATALALWYFRDVYRRLEWGWSWQAVAIGVAVFVVWIWLEPVPDQPPTLPTDLAVLPAWLAALWLLFRVFGSVLAVPLAEEFAFRGYLLRKFAARNFEEVDPRRFAPFAFFASSLLFGLLHDRWLAGTLAGMAYALAVYRRGRIGDAVVAHGTTNGLIAVSVLLFHQWQLWT